MDIIRKIFEPTIEVKNLEILNKASDKSRSDDIGERKIGSTSPYLIIRDMQFFDDSVISFELSTEKFLPRVIATISDVNSRLNTDALPLDDILSVYIKSDNKDFKGIRQDYRIINFHKRGNDYVVEAILEVKGLWVDRIKGFDGTSFEFLKIIAKELKLGFSSNLEATNDKMYHICPNINYHDFINNELMNVCYLDNKSFFICYIDQFYYLNVVEVNRLVKRDWDISESSSVYIGEEHSIDKTREVGNQYISNHPRMGGKPAFLIEYDINNRAGRSGIKNGYKTNLIYYDKNNEKYDEFFIETITTDGITDNDIVIKGEIDENHLENTRDISLGSYFQDNVHKNYYVAKVMNNYNSEELAKVNLPIEIAGIDFGLYNYQSIPLEIMVKDQSYVDLDQRNEEEGLNKALSGMYIITGLKYLYDKDDRRFFQKMVLKRREYKKINR